MARPGSVDAKLASCVMLMICMVMVVLIANAPHAEAITCGEVVTKLSPCLGYLTSSGGPVPQPCCDGVRSLNSLAKTTPDRQTACNCLKSTAGSIAGLKPGLVSGLPGKCSVKIPYPISTSTDCTKVK